jgi:hypothetical protein
MQSIIERELNALILHHNIEIKRLINSNEDYKHENISLLKNEIDSFIKELSNENN